MDPATRTILVERNAYPLKGPRFFREDDAVMFEFVIDTANIIGPRQATRSDQEKHPGAWAQFIATEGVSPLDRDANHANGGSLPADVKAEESPPITHVSQEHSQGQPTGYQPQGRKARRAKA